VSAITQTLYTCDACATTTTDNSGWVVVLARPNPKAAVRLPKGYRTIAGDYCPRCCA
jgi:hypothetical protein